MQHIIYQLHATFYDRETSEVLYRFSLLAQSARVIDLLRDCHIFKQYFITIIRKHRPRRLGVHTEFKRLNTRSVSAVRNFTTSSWCP